MNTYRLTILEMITKLEGSVFFLAWFKGMHPSTKNVWDNLTDSQLNIFLLLFKMFLSNLGYGDSDFSAGFVPYKPSLDTNLYLTLILLAASRLANNPKSLFDCWLSWDYDDHGYFYVKTSKSANAKKYHRIKSLRLFSSFVIRPCFTNKDGKEADHICNRPNCFNPFHGRNVTSAQNKDHCRFGCQHYCPHEPLCMWTHPNGRSCKHRNDPNVAYQKSDCNCRHSCFSVECEGGNPKHK